jgi:hypothetical protein
MVMESVTVSVLLVMESVTVSVLLVMELASVMVLLVVYNSVRVHDIDNNHHI